MSRYNNNNHIITNYTLDRLNVPDFLGQLTRFVHEAVPLLDDSMKSVNDQSRYNLYTGKIGIAMAYHRAQQELITDERDDDNFLPYTDFHVKGCEEERKHRHHHGIGLTSDCLALHLYECLRNHEEFDIDEIHYKGNIDDEILNGRAGLAIVLDYFASKGLKLTRPDLISDVVNHIPADKFPWAWGGKLYYGAAHGTSGILLAMKRFGGQWDIDMYNQILRLARYPSGNFRSSEGSRKDEMIQWCHGAPGFLPMLYEFESEFKGKGGKVEEENNKVILEALDACWQRGILTKGASICHGIAGNAYPFLIAFIRTGNPRYLAQATAFATEILYSGPMHCCGNADRPFSLFEGLAGVVHFMLDLKCLIKWAAKKEEEKIRNFILFDGLRIWN